MAGPASPTVGLFVTCLVDLFRPTVGFAAVKLLRQAGCQVVVPRGQTCCGQPAYNGGDRADAQALAKQVITAFADVDYVVVPSGSCGGMIAAHYPELFDADPVWHGRAEELACRSHELVSFLTDVMGVETVDAAFDGTVTYHDSCAGLRELNVKHQPRRLLASVRGLHVRELPGAEVCCGFGGTFCVKYADISDHIVGQKVDDIAATGAATVLAGDLGCLMNMAGKLTRTDTGVQARHVAEVLAGMCDAPPIGHAASPGPDERKPNA